MKAKIEYYTCTGQIYSVPHEPITLRVVPEGVLCQVCLGLIVERDKPCTPVTIREFDSTKGNAL
jgi:hypothetical protein